MVERRGEVVQRFVNAWARALRFIDAEREETTRFAREAERRASRR